MVEVDSPRVSPGRGAGGGLKRRRRPGRRRCWPRVSPGRGAGGGLELVRRRVRRRRGGVSPGRGAGGGLKQLSTPYFFAPCFRRFPRPWCRGRVESARREGVQ